MPAGWSAAALAESLIADTGRNREVLAEAGAGVRLVSRFDDETTTEGPGPASTAAHPKARTVTVAAAGVQTPPSVRSVEFTVPGRPQAWQRVRRGRRGKSYVPAATAAAETAIGWEARLAMGELRPFDGPVRMSFTAYMPRPKGVTQGAVYPIQPGAADIDNLEKTILDGLQGVAFVNDRQVVTVTKTKVFGGEPRLHVLVEAL